ncbi:hypothetical protein [Pararoseomonas baculiformis]|uniref:hypothetical protein n=1 Tax=Pararoseomonas baculiformis TaxID=2820812 RepID=UPI001FD82DFA|nr:hypothetical protein [Pararoseomonas baculiformis]
MANTARAAIKALQPELIAIRRDILANPEMGMEEVLTSRLVADTLRGLRLEVAGGDGGR